MRINQTSRTSSPWRFTAKIKMLLWEYIWVLFCRWTPKPFNKWRVFWLKMFGAKIVGAPFVHQRAIIQIPWNLILHDGACIGDRAIIYTLDIIEIKKNATVAQEVYLCTGSHDFSNEIRPLVTSSIVIYENAFVGARAFILPGVTIGQNSIVGAGSIVTKSIESNSVVVGNPAKYIKRSIS